MLMRPLVTRSTSLCRMLSTQIPDDHMKETLETFLSSPHFKGVGPTIAKRVVEEVGVPGLVKLLEPYRIRGLTASPLEKPRRGTPEPPESHLKPLANIPGVSPKRLETLNSGLNQLRHLSPLYSFKAVHGLSRQMIGILEEKYMSEDQVLHKLVSNPYVLCLEVPGIGFHRADQVANVLGIAQKHPHLRVEAAIWYGMQRECYGMGNVFVKTTRLFHQTKRTMGGKLEMPVYEKALEMLVEKNDLVMDQSSNGVYLRRLYEMELNCSQRIARHVRDKSKMNTSQVDLVQVTDHYCNRENVQLTVEQRKAIVQVLENPFSIITGNPGVGKTFVLKALADIWRLVYPNHSDSPDVVMLSPTGRGASRIKELTGVSHASTIHRALSPLKGVAKLDAGLIVIDEVSMVDLFLLEQFLDKLDKDTTVVFVGDPFQLPSIGPGNVLGDLLSVKDLPQTALTQIFRQEAASDIVKVSAAVRDGEIPHHILTSWNKSVKVSEGNAIFMEQNDPPVGALPDLRADCAEEFRQNILELYENVIPSLKLSDGSCINPKAEVQFLCPRHSHFSGTINVNQVVSEYLFPERRKEERFSPGDRVMQMKNNYSLNVYNGDIGTIVETVAFSEEEVEKLKLRSGKWYKSVFVDFGLDSDGKPIILKYSKEDQEALVHAWAISVHKSQGSEFPVVVVPLFLQDSILLYRECIYTALTRAKTLLVFIGSKAALEKSVTIKNIQFRYSALGQRVSSELRIKKKRSVK